jgi:hypothetical protein
MNSSSNDRSLRGATADVQTSILNRVIPGFQSGAAPMDNLRWGILSTANIARLKVVPGMRKARRSNALASRAGAAPGA